MQDLTPPVTAVEAARAGLRVVVVEDRHALAEIDGAQPASGLP